ncbi:MAG: LysM peptidoglycan-binding domain-containing protein [Treponema sp.]|jgi:hypothetical protein|nr:LysM peptidoglycan-binding domain-containing protein [Treponema sp.]
MNRNIFIAVLVLLFAILPVFGQESEIPDSLLYNEYYLESVRLNKLAQETYDYGDYDASAGFAEEALRYAQLSDEYINGPLMIRADEAIAAAKQRLDWAAANDAANRYPIEYNQSRSYYDASLAAHNNEQWSNAVNSANRAVELLAFIAGTSPAPVTTAGTGTAPVTGTGTAPAAGTGTTAGGISPLPKQYTVRSWAAFRDCLWNIAGYPWVYGDPEKWRLLYDANKSQISNPDVIEPGMVLDIPSIKGETRQGMWDSGKTYEKL